MIRKPQPAALRFAPVVILLVIFGYMCILPPRALAQGSAVVSITSPSPGASVAGTIEVRASVSPAGVMVAGVQFKLDGVDLGMEDATAPYSIPWDTTTTSSGLHTLTAVARDALGLRFSSDPVPATVSNGPPTETRLEETDLSTTYSLGWIHRTAGRPWSGGTAAYSSKTDVRATFTFAGTSAKWIGYRGPLGGIALVSLDGVLVAQVDTYSPTEEIQAVVYSTPGLESGHHKLGIEVTGLQNPASMHSIIAVDAFDVSPPSPPPTMGTRVEESDRSSTYTAGWSQGDTTTPWSGGTAAVSATPGAQADFTFPGTSVNWIGLRGPQAGIARVFVDGVLQAEVDTYAASRLQAVVFTVSGLPAGGHTLRIEVTGLKNPASTDSLIMVDAFDVRSRFEQTHPSVAYTGTWEVTDSRAWSETTAVYAWAAGARANFTFNGTSVSWIGYRGPVGGIARVFLDGVFVAEIDTYSAADEVQAVIFSAAGLAAGSHTLTIEATGTQNPAATKPFVAVDAFDINF